MLVGPASEFNNIGLVINFTRACLLLEYQVSRRASSPAPAPTSSNPQISSTL